MIAGLLLFARYAFPPNRLGYCGSPDHEGLFGYLTEERADPGLRELAQKFEGAYPYLRLIAEANGQSDPFDPRVVEAYWIGNAFLARVGVSQLYESLRRRFQPRMEPRAFSWMTSALADGTRPHHNFHVFEVYRRAGLLRDERAVVALERMDQCRVAGAGGGGDREPLPPRDGRREAGPRTGRAGEDSPPGGRPRVPR